MKCRSYRLSFAVFFIAAILSHASLKGGTSLVITATQIKASLISWDGATAVYTPATGGALQGGTFKGTLAVHCNDPAGYSITLQASMTASNNVSKGVLKGVNTPSYTASYAVSAIDASALSGRGTISTITPSAIKLDGSAEAFNVVNLQSPLPIQTTNPHLIGLTFTVDAPSGQVFYPADTYTGSITVSIANK